MNYTFHINLNNNETLTTLAIAVLDAAHSAAAVLAAAAAAALVCVVWLVYKLIVCINDTRESKSRTVF